MRNTSEANVQNNIPTFSLYNPQASLTLSQLFNPAVLAMMNPSLSSQVYPTFMPQSPPTIDDLINKLSRDSLLDPGSQITNMNSSSSQTALALSQLMNPSYGANTNNQTNQLSDPLMQAIMAAQSINSQAGNLLSQPNALNPGGY